MKGELHMSIFCIGGPEGVIVPEHELKFTPDEDRYFLPGIIHGSEDYLIQAYYWSNDEGPKGDRIGLKYLHAEHILAWAEESTDNHGHLDTECFEELINEEAEEFVIENDGDGEFCSLNEVWDKSVNLDYEDIINWAKEKMKV
ncbi:MAG: hypothetical protein II305_06295 [Clostridia bacterium]|nr:hypothetical protein [Clostridia bacterium]